MGLPPLKEVKEVIGFEEANKYLHNGWILVSTHMAGECQPGVTHPTMLYVLGRPGPWKPSDKTRK
jgi:hypothetical protein